MKYMKKVFCALGCIALFSGCSTPNSKIDPAVFSKPSTIVVAQVSGLDKPGFFKKGNQGLIAYAISSGITSDVADQIEKIDAKPIVEDKYYNTFENTLSNKSMKVIKLSTPLDRNQLERPKEDQPSTARYDFSALKNNHGAQYALVLDPQSFGTARQYYGVIPLGAPKGWAAFTVSMINLENNSIVGHYNANFEISAEGDWDTPPHYQALKEASLKALSKGLQEAHGFLLPAH